jgi:hypothetical protein
MRRGLMIVAKIIQNLANNIFFGKEQHMTALNGFLQAHIVHVTRFLSELNVRFLFHTHFIRRLIASIRRNTTTKAKTAMIGLGLPMMTQIPSSFIVSLTSMQTRLERSFSVSRSRSRMTAQLPLAKRPGIISARLWLKWASQWRCRIHLTSLAPIMRNFRLS